MPVEIHRFIRQSFWSALLLVSALLAAGGVAHAQAPGGFVESATSNGLRPRLSAGEIQAFLPSRGRFTFPSPYGTTGIRLTNAGDCGGSDCVSYVGYSYWRNINNHVGSDTMLIFLGLKGPGPTLFSYNKNTGEWVDRRSGTSGASALQSGKAVVLVSDWNKESDISDSGFSEAAANSTICSSL